MAHGITSIDKGVIWGRTWHGLSQYLQQEMPVTVQQAIETVNFPIAKEQLFRSDGKPVDGAFCLVRADHNTVVAPTVGDRFCVVPNADIVRYVDEMLLSVYPDLKIESVGTLFGGSTTFLNLVVESFHVKGDRSETLCRLMYFNPLGRGSHQVCCHGVRVVCNNTLRMAEAQGAASQTLTKIRHTASAAHKINAAMDSLAEIKLGLKKHIEALDWMALQPVTAEYVTRYMEHLFPTKADASKAGETRLENKREALLQLFENDSTFEGAVNRSRYALLQATTNYVDSQMGANRKSTDEASRRWDGIVGVRADLKDKAMAFLSVA